MIVNTANLKLPLLFILLVIYQGTPQATASSLVQHKNAPVQQQQQLQHHNIPQQQQHVQQAQYVHEKDSLHDAMKNEHLSNSNIEDDLGDTYQILNDIKQEARLPAPLPSGANYFPWNWFPQFSPLAVTPNTPLTTSHPFESMASPLHAAKFLPFYGYPQPIFIPYPLYITPDMFYPTAAAAAPFASANDIDESMSRAADGRRSSSVNSGYQRNSPIYYMRLPPPSPYMFLPGLGFTAASSSLNHPQSAGSFAAGFSPIMPYNSLSTLSAYSSIFNPPVNFLANGKPTNIYQMSGSPNDIQQSPLQFASFSGFGSRPPPPNPYRPTSSFPQSNGNYLSQPSYGAASPPQQDSKLTALKHPFIFNGRPEEIYILPNNFNPLYSDSSLSGYY